MLPGSITTSRQRAQGRPEEIIMWTESVVVSRMGRKAVEILAGLLLFAYCAVPSLAGDTTTNPVSSHPICVDASITPGTSDYSNTTYTGYTTGSLYTSKLTTSSGFFNAQVSTILEAKGTYLVCILASSKVPESAGFGVNVGADISFCMRMNGKNVRVRMQVRGNGSDGFTTNVITPRGTTTPDALGIIVAAGYSHSNILSADGNYLTVEYAIPLGSQGYCNDRMVGVFFDGTNGHQVSDALVSVNGDKSTTIDANYVPDKLTIEIGNVGFTNSGLVPVTIVSSPEFNAMTIDPSTVVLRDTSFDNSVDLVFGLDFLSAFYTTGARPVKSNVHNNNNGGQDLVLYFSTQDLKNFGFFTLNTTEAVLAGKTITGGTVSGKAPVTIKGG
jgi:hypothetical protein